MLQAGDTLAGYRIEAVAGVGGMGVVYRATQLSLDRPVALKVLSSTLVGNRTFRERFRREGRHAAALDHPNIIPVYEAGESNGLMFIAMRLVDGPSLADLIAAEQVTGSEALRVVGAIASALDAAHEDGLVHRDIKPQNILLTKSGHPYLADFGITKGGNHGGLTHSGDFVGSLNYVAPEQIHGKDVTGASDIYSLAAVLFHCLTGTFPYERETDAALMLAHIEAPPPSLGALDIAAPAALDKVFEKGMAKAPEERYATASELVEACREAVAQVDSKLLDRAPAFPAPALPDTDEAPARQTEPDQDVWTTPAPDLSARAVAPVVGLTEADRKRVPPSPDAPPPATRRVSKGALAIAGVVVLLIAAPIAGYALGHDDPPPKPGTAGSAGLTLMHDATWSSTSGGIEGLKLTHATTLRRADGLRLTAGRMPEFRLGFDPVPRALSKRFETKSPPVAVRLGSQVAVRHVATLASGERLWIALLPDSKGWTAVACEGPRADAPDGCPAVASTLELIGAGAVALGPDKQVAAQINDALTKLNKVRKAEKPRLKARKAGIRASAARLSSRAHARAANALSRLSLRPQEAPLVDKLADALDGQASSLKRLARAASRRRVADYDAARAAIRKREKRVRRALARLRSIGYRTS